MAGNINKAYQLVIQACNDPWIGYSMSNRRSITLGVNYPTYCDCSSLLAWALSFSGFYANNPWFTTYTMSSYLSQAGFRSIPLTTPWVAGDICLRAEHTEMVYQGYVTMGAHTSGIAYAEQVSINNWASSPGQWSSLWRYGKGADPAAPVYNISIYVIAAIVGNWSRESNVNPGIWEGLVIGGQGYGLGQWSFGRRDKLFEYLDSHGYSRDDGMGQCMFFYEENDWQSATSTPLKFNNLMDFLTSSSTDIDALTETFMNAWERPGVPGLSDRISFAHKAYDYIKAHSNDNVQWITGNRYLSESEQLNNAVACYQALAMGMSPNGPQGWSNTLRYGCFRDLYRRLLIMR